MQHVGYTSLLTGTVDHSLFIWDGFEDRLCRTLGRFKLYARSLTVSLFVMAGVNGQRILATPLPHGVSWTSCLSQTSVKGWRPLHESRLMLRHPHRGVSPTTRSGITFHVIAQTKMIFLGTPLDRSFLDSEMDPGLVAPTARVAPTCGLHICVSCVYTSCTAQTSVTTMRMLYTTHTTQMCTSNTQVMLDTHHTPSRVTCVMSCTAQTSVCCTRHSTRTTDVSRTLPTCVT